LFALGIAALCASVLVPYWKLRVVAPQYPKGLVLVIHLNNISGDVQEINTLNHYIGMRRIDDAARMERKFAIPGIIVVAFSLLAALWFRKRWSFWFAIPAILFPLIFAVDLYWWLSDSGLNLNPKAPLSSSIEPFIPPLFGRGKIAQFQAFAQFGLGFYLSLAAGVLALIGSLIRFKKTRSFKQFAFAIFMGGAIFFSCPSLFAETFVVSPEGPYFDIHKAVEAASDHDTILVRGGIYHGPIVISKSIDLIGESNPVLDGLGKGTVIKLLAPETRLKGFIIRNSGEILSADDAGIYAAGKNTIIENNQLEEVLFGIYLSRASNSVIRNNALRGKSVSMPRRGDLIRVWYSDEILIEGNQVFEGRDSVLWYSKRSVIRNNFIQSGRYGLHFMYCHETLVEGNHLRGNSVGAYLMYSADIRVRSNQIVSNRGPSGYGLGFKDMNGSFISNNVIADNRAAFYLDGATGIYQENVIAHNDVGIQMLTSASGNQFIRNSFMDNGEQVLIESMGYVTSNEWKRNFWSDYRGYDLNHDGVGDTAYQAFQFFEHVTDRYHVLKFFRSSLSVKALEFATTLFPVFAPKPKFSDQEPLLNPVLFSKEARQTISERWIAISLALLLFPFGLLASQLFLNRALSPEANPS
jgi:nitrous oxidase accessory protein